MKICMQDLKEMQRIIEAVLFAAGHAVTYERLALLLETTEDEVKKTVGYISDSYADPSNARGIQLVCYDKSCQLCTKEEYIDYIRAALGIRRGGNLSKSSLEVLAIVAYHQPVTRAFVEQVRGIDSSYAVGALADKGLIEVCGKLDAPGRPSLYRTTDDFLKCFGLDSLGSLPPVELLEAELAAKLADGGADTIASELSDPESQAVDEHFADGTTGQDEAQ